MKIFVIHDYRRPDEELSRLKTELAYVGIRDYIIWPGTISGCDSVPGCIALSHQNVIRQALAMDLPEVCVMESDVWFLKHDGWEYFLKNKPDAFDIYSACTYDQLVELRRFASFRKSKRGPVGCYHTDHLIGFHCYIMHRQYFEKFLESPPGHIDAAQDGRGNFRICYPFAALQRRGWSANHRKEVDYNAEMTKRDVYGSFESL